MSNPHKAIYGVSMQGKTWLMKRLSKQLLKYKRKVIVWSGVGDLDFGKGAKTTLDIDMLEYWLKNPSAIWPKEQYKGAHVMIDEARVLFSEAASRKKYPNINNLGTMGRHKGFSLYVATQYPTSVPPAIRINCSECYCFKLTSQDQAKLVYEDYGGLAFEGEPINKIIPKLDKLHALHIKNGEVNLIKL